MSICPSHKAGRSDWSKAWSSATTTAEDIKVAYVAVPDLELRAVAQRYTRLSDRRFLYEGTSSGFTAELHVDEMGIVIDYPGIFRRIPG